MGFILIISLVCLLSHEVVGETVNGVDVDKACQQNLATARMYCRSTEDEPPAIKPKCDLFRKYCSDNLAGATPPPAMCRQIGYCNQFSSRNSLICNNAAYANGSPDRQSFCANYKSLCANVPEDPDDTCGFKSGATAAPVYRAIPNAFSGPMPVPGLPHLLDLNGGSPMATVGQSSLDRIPQNMAQSAANAPLFGILGGLAGLGKNAAGTAAGAAGSGDFGSLGSGLLAGAGNGGSNPNPNPTGPALGIQTVPGFDAAAQHGPFGTSPLWVGNNVAVGPFANGGRSTSVNPFGKIGTGIQGGAMGFTGYAANGVDYGSVPGLTDLNNPLIGGRRRRRYALKNLRLNNFLRFL